MKIKIIFYVIIAIISLFLVQSIYQYYVLVSFVSEQKKDIFSGFVNALMQPKITDIKFNILLELVSISICLLMVNWNKIKQ
jgi:hypothetical protein